MPILFLIVKLLLFAIVFHLIKIKIGLLLFLFSDFIVVIITWVYILHSLIIISNLIVFKGFFNTIIFPQNVFFVLNEVKKFHHLFDLSNFCLNLLNFHMFVFIHLAIRNFFNLFYIIYLIFIKTIIKFDFHTVVIFQIWHFN